MVLGLAVFEESGISIYMAELAIPDAEWEDAWESVEDSSDSDINFDCEKIESWDAYTDCQLTQTDVDWSDAESTSIIVQASNCDEGFGSYVLGISVNGEPTTLTLVEDDIED